jgi:heme/copper-type cytochrome/quinol oxidase subunit 2
MRLPAVLLPALALAFATGIAAAEGPPEFMLTIKDHAFSPAELTVPAGQKVKLKVVNADATPEEFESHELNREKVIPGGATATIFVGPLKPGTYPFFGEFNPKTAQGKLIAK